MVYEPESPDIYFDECDRKASERRSDEVISEYFDKHILRLRLRRQLIVVVTRARPASAAGVVMVSNTAPHDAATS